MNWFKTIEILTCGSVRKDFCQLITDLWRGKTCPSNKDKLNKIFRINQITEMNKIIKVIKLNQIIKVIKIMKIKKNNWKNQNSKDNKMIEQAGAELGQA